MKPKFPVLLLSSLLVVLSTLPATQAGEITIGSVSYNPAKEIKKYKLLTDYLNSLEEIRAIGEVKIRITDNINGMIDLMKSGQVDMYIDSPFPSFRLQESGVSKIALRRWKGGVAEYHSVIFVRKDSDIHTLSDLRGKLFAFEEPFSTSGYYLPKSSLIQNGFTVSEKENRGALIADDEIGYIFSEADDTTVTWVRKNRAAAGAIDNVKFDKIKDKIRQQFRVIHRTINVPRQVVNFRSDLSANTRTSIAKALLEMHHSEYGRLQLKAFKETLKFDEFPVSLEQALLPIKSMANSVQ